MASTKQIELSTLIKNVHGNLRLRSQVVGVEAAWQEHCKNEDTLRRYAEAMQELATKHWECNYNYGSKAASRITWIYEACIQYFYNDIIYYRKREENIANKVDIEIIVSTQDEYKVIKLLDVGSCYNPFGSFQCFDVTAIDIAPANAEVIKCDFLNLQVLDTTSTKVNNGKNDQLVLTQHSFDVIVFSLVLEYLPSPEHRLLFCKKAYKLLKPEGTLFIITPDSKHVGANCRLIKSWRYLLAELGFSRIKYEKLSHIHCMVFRKSLCAEIAQRWSKLHKDYKHYDQILIPQDFNTCSEPVMEMYTQSTGRDNLLLLSELPHVHFDED